MSIELGGASGGARSLSGTTAARPAASAVTAGTLYYSTTDGLLYRSDGSAWTRIAPGEIDRAERTAPQASIGTTETDLTGFSLPTFTVGDRPVEVMLYVPLVQKVTSNGLIALKITNASNVQQGQWASNVTTNSFAGPCIAIARYAAGTGAVTVKGRGVTDSNTFHLWAGTDYKAFIKAYEV